MPSHNKLKMFIMLLTLAIYTIMVVMNAGAGSGAFRGVFHTVVGNISRHHDTDLTPERWTFFIWNIIFLWQYGWLVYSLSGLCRRNELGWVYMQPDLLPIPFYLVWMLNNALNVGWLFLWDAIHFIAALLILAFLTLTNFVALFISHKALYPHAAWLQKHSKADLWLTRILVQNGIALYATWTTIATLLNFTVVLIYNGNVSNKTATVTSLCILFFELIVWFFMENFLLDKYVRYNLTVYPVVILALSGTLKKNYSVFPSTIGIITATMLTVACIIFSIRLGLVTWRHNKEALDGSLASPAIL